MASTLDLSLKIRALVQGLKDVESLTNEVEALAKEAGADFNDPTPPLTGGARTAATELGKLKTQVVALAASLGAGALAKSFLDSAVAVENFKNQLTTIEGSSEAAEQSLDWIRDFATQTPYDLNEVTGAFVKLKSYGIDPTDGSLQTLGDTASAMGKDINQAVEALADAMTGEYERLKEFGIKARTEGDKVKFTYVSNGKEMAKEADKNSATMIKSTLEAIWNERYQGGMERFMTSWSGMTSNLGDLWTKFKTEVMDAGVFDALKGALEDLIGEIETASQNGELQRWAQDVGKAVTALINGLVSLTKFMAENRETVELLATAFLSYKAATSGIAQATLSFGSALVKMGTGAKGATVAMQGLGRAFGAIAFASLALDLIKIAGALREISRANALAEEHAANLAVTLDRQKEALAALAERTGLAIPDMDAFNQLVKDGTLVAGEGEHAWVLASEAMSDTGTAAAGAADGIDASKTAAVDAAVEVKGLAGALAEAAAAGGEAKTKLQELISELDLTDPAKITELSAEMAGLRITSQETAAAVDEQLVVALGKLNPEQLGQVGAAIKTAFDAGAMGAQELERLNNEVLVASFEALGLTAETELGRISPAAQDGIAAVDAIRASLELAGDNGEAKMAALGAAISAALEKADTLVAVDELKSRIEQMGKTGELAGTNLETALEGVRKKLRTLTPGVNDVQEAFEQLGITSPAELKKVEASARSAYQTIKQSGQPIEIQRQAWMAYAKTAIDANNGVASASLKAEASALGLKEELQKLTGANVDLKNATGDSKQNIRDLGNEADTTAGKMANLKRNTEEAAEAQKRFTGGTRTVNVSQMDQAYGEFMKSKRIPFMGRRWYENAMDEWSKMTDEERTAFIPGEKERRAKEAAAEAAKREPAAPITSRTTAAENLVQPVKTVRMNLNLGGKTSSFDVLEGQESAVESLLRDLEKSMGVVQ